MVSFMTLQNSMDERKLKNYQAFDHTLLSSIGAFPLHGTARYGTVRFTFGGFSTGYCTWYLILF